MAINEKEITRLLPPVLICNLHLNGFKLGIEFMDSREPIEIEIDKPANCKKQLKQISEKSLIESVKKRNKEIIKVFEKHKLRKVTYEFVDLDNNEVQSDIELFAREGWLLVHVDKVHRTWLGRLFDGYATKTYTVGKTGKVS